MIWSLPTAAVSNARQGQGREQTRDPELMLGQPVALMRMFLCRTCGNKRCPGADDHRLRCSWAAQRGGSQRWERLCR